MRRVIYCEANSLWSEFQIFCGGLFLPRSLYGKKAMSVCLCRVRCSTLTRSLHGLPSLIHIHSKAEDSRRACQSHMSRCCVLYRRVWSYDKDFIFPFRSIYGLANLFQLKIAFHLTCHKYIVSDWFTNGLKLSVMSCSGLSGRSNK